jgi:hypothetical protein
MARAIAGGRLARNLTVVFRLRVLCHWVSRKGRKDFEDVVAGLKPSARSAVVSTR